MKKKLTALAALFIIFALVSLPVAASAKELAFESQYIKLTVDDDVLIMTSSTSKYDEVWSQAGVGDPKSRIDELSQRNVVASFYDPKTKTTVDLIAKYTQGNPFSFDDMTDQEIISYISTGLDSDPNIKLDTSIETHNNIRYFRMFLDTMNSTSDNIQKIYELVYGTAKNSQIIEFDCYSANGVVPDETFMTKLIDNMSFTRIMTRAEYDEEVHKARVKLVILVACFFALIIGFIVYAILRRRVKKKRIELIGEATSAFYQNRKDGTIPDDLPIAFTSTCTYNELAITSFMTYQTWLRFLPVLIPSGILYIWIIVSMFTRGSMFVAAITIGAGIYLLYTHYSRLEKVKESMKKRYSSAPEATVRFREAFFDVLGLGAISEYPYHQITSVGHYNGYTFIYIGEEKAVFMSDKNITPGSVTELNAFIKERRKAALEEAKALSGKTKIIKGSAKEL